MFTVKLNTACAAPARSRICTWPPVVPSRTWALTLAAASAALLELTMVAVPGVTTSHVTGVPGSLFPKPSLISAESATGSSAFGPPVWLFPPRIETRLGGPGVIVSTVYSPPASLPPPPARTRMGTGPPTTPPIRTSQTETPVEPERAVLPSPTQAAVGFSAGSRSETRSTPTFGMPRPVSVPPTAKARIWIAPARTWPACPVSVRSAAGASRL